MKHRAFTVAACPASSGDVVALLRADSGALVYFCPDCECAWNEFPAAVDSIQSLIELAPGGVKLPTARELEALGVHASGAVDVDERDFRVPLDVNFELRISAPNAGWMAFGFACGAHEVSIDASFTPSDSFERLVDAGGFLLDGFKGERTVTFNEEPRQIDVSFSVDAFDGSVVVRVAGFADHRRGKSLPRSVLWQSRCRARAVATAIAAAARDVVVTIGADDFGREWRHSFPTATLARIEAELAS